MSASLLRSRMQKAKEEKEKEDNEAERKTGGENERNEAIKRNQKKRGIYLSTKKMKSKASRPIVLRFPFKRHAK